MLKCVRVCLGWNLYFCLAGRAANSSRLMPEIVGSSVASGLKTNPLQSCMLTRRPRVLVIGKDPIIRRCWCVCVFTESRREIDPEIYLKVCNVNKLLSPSLCVYFVALFNMKCHILCVCLRVLLSDATLHCMSSHYKLLTWVFYHNNGLYHFI